MTLQNDGILICGHLMRYPLIKLFHLSNLLQILNDDRMVDVEFFGNFSHSCKRISFHDGSQLVIVNFRWPVTEESSGLKLLIFKGLISFAKLLESLLQYTFVSSFWAKCVVDVVSCLHRFMTHFELE